MDQPSGDQPKTAEETKAYWSAEQQKLSQQIRQLLEATSKPLLDQYYKNSNAFETIMVLQVEELCLYRELETYMQLNTFTQEIWEEWKQRMQTFRKSMSDRAEAAKKVVAATAGKGG